MTTATGIGPQTAKAMELANQITLARQTKALEAIKNGSIFTQTAAAEEMAEVMRKTQAMAGQGDKQHDAIIKAAMQHLGVSRD
jgi:hypothetical protein